MPFDFHVQKRKPSPTRKLPYLPRIGLYVDFGARELTLKYVPLLESLLNVAEQPKVTVAAFSRVVKQQIGEVAFPKLKRQKTIDVRAHPVEASS